uniref:V-type proton ATPase subunit S1/VOA1 transmembrane domain-containing protein n=1 Tax=Plectus sambesii TaxID=2011161 RepID=A0A914WK72_9BILA
MIDKFDQNRLGGPYSEETWKEIRNIVNSDYNTSETTAAFNKRMNRNSEIELKNYFDEKEGWEWNKLSPGAQRRYREQSDAWKDIRDDFRRTSNTLVCWRDLGRCVDLYHLLFAIFVWTSDIMVGGHRVLLLLLPSIAFCFDAVVWSSGDAIDRKSPPALSKLIESATLEKPLVLFVLKNFQLADFSKHANVYGEPDKATKGLKKWIVSSKGYAAEWLDEPAQLPAGKYVEYKGELAALTEQPVVLVNVDSFAVIDDLADNVLQSLDRPYTAVLTGEDALTTHAIQKRVVTSDMRGEVRASSSRDAPTGSGQLFPIIAPSENTSSCLLYLGQIAVMVYLPNGKGDRKLSTTVIKNGSYEFTGPACKNASMALNGTDALSYQITMTKLPTDTPDFTVSQLEFRLSARKTATGYWLLNDIDSITIELKPNGTKFLNGITPAGVTEIKTLTGSGMASTKSWGVVSVPTYSYACTATPTAWTSQLTVNGNTNISGLPNKDLSKVQMGIALGQFQIQPFGVTYYKFSRNVDDCVPTFSVGSWMGIVVGLIFLGAFLFAMTMLNSVQTMDRFDDPKQKQIIINFKE